MAALEEEGLIAAPHTSAGRIPTDAGYRLFVDRLSAVKPMSAAEQRAIGQFLEGAVDLDDVVDRTVRLLASLTRQVAVVQYPSLARSAVRHVELVPIGAGRLLVVLITTTGRVEQRVIDVGADLLTEDGEALSSALAHADHVKHPGGEDSRERKQERGHPRWHPRRHPRAERIIPKSRDFH